MKKKIIIILCVVLSLAIALGAVFLIIRKPDKKAGQTPEDNISGTVSVEEPLKNTENADSSAAEITDDGTGLKPDETKADEILSSAEKKTSSVYNEPVLQPETKADNTLSSTEEITSSVHSEPQKKYVKDADPETGISWDGESQIIYRTASGLTTEKTYGGYYEIRPGEWVLLPYPIEKEAISDKCEYCGRIRGDGSGGTCLRYSLSDSDMTCPNCGANIPKHTCHTCGG